MARPFRLSHFYTCYGWRVKGYKVALTHALAFPFAPLRASAHSRTGFLPGERGDLRAAPSRPSPMGPTHRTPANLTPTNRRWGKVVGVSEPRILRSLRSLKNDIWDTTRRCFVGDFVGTQNDISSGRSQTKRPPEYSGGLLCLARVATR